MRPMRTMLAIALCVTGISMALQSFPETAEATPGSVRVECIYQCNRKNYDCVQKAREFQGSLGQDWVVGFNERMQECKNQKENCYRTCRDKPM